MPTTADAQRPARPSDRGPLRPRPKLTRRKKALFVAVTLLLLLLLVEIPFHIWFYRTRGFPAWRQPSFTAPQLHMEYDHPYLPFVRGADPGRHHGTNRMGFRGQDVPLHKKPNEIRILCCGGSTTVDQPEFEKSWPGLLEKKLQTAHPDKKIVVLVQAHGAYMTSDNLVFYTLRAQDYNFDWLVILDGWNDMVASTIPGFLSDYSHARARPYPFHPVSPAIGRFKARFPLFRYSAALATLENVLIAREFGAFNNAMWKGREQPSEGVRGVDTFRRNIETFAKLAAANGSSVLLVSQIEQAKLEYTDRDSNIQHLINAEHNAVLENVAASLPRCYYCDLDALFPQVDSYFGDRIHFSETGADFIATSLARVFTDRSWLSTRNPNNYTRSTIICLNELTKAVRSGPYQGAFPPAFAGVPTAHGVHAGLLVQAHAEPSQETGLRLPLGFLPRGTYRLDTGAGYYSYEYKPERSQGGGVCFRAKLRAGDTSIAIFQNELKPTSANLAAIVRDHIEGQFTVGDGEAELELTTQLLGKEANPYYVWLYPIIHRIDHEPARRDGPGPATQKIE